MNEKKTIRAKWSAKGARHYCRFESIALTVVEWPPIGSNNWKAYINQRLVGLFADPETACLAAESAAIDLCRRVIASLEDVGEGVEEQR